MSLLAQILKGYNYDGRVRYFKLRFLDSYQFMASSLATLMDNMRETDLRLCHSLSLPMHLIRAKGVFPYSYLDSANKLDEPFLPPRDAFALARMYGT